MAEYTFLKIQVDDVSFSANAPFSGEDDEDEDDESGGLSRAVPFVLGLLVLLAIGVAVKKFLGDSTPSGE